MKLSEEEIEIECNKLLITLKINHIDGKIIQILYDLYEQEKEKNEELIEGQLETLEKILLPELSQKYISKDKIRDFALSETQADTYHFKTVSLDRLLKFLEEE